MIGLDHVIDFGRTHTRNKWIDTILTFKSPKNCSHSVMQVLVADPLATCLILLVTGSGGSMPHIEGPNHIRLDKLSVWPMHAT